MSTSVEVEFFWDLAEADRFLKSWYRYERRPSGIMFVLLVHGGLCALAGSLAWKLPVIANRGIVLVAILLPLAIELWLLLAYARGPSAEKLFQADPELNRTARAVVTRDGWRAWTDLSQVEHHWSLVRRIVRMPDGFGIVYGGVVRWLPISGFRETGAVESFVELIRQVGVEYKDHTSPD